MRAAVRILGDAYLSLSPRAASVQSAVVADPIATGVADPDLQTFEAEGAPELPRAEQQGVVVHDGARIWYASHGSGPPVVLLHGGLGHSGNWGYQVPALLHTGYRVVLTDSRGQGRSTRVTRPYSSGLM